MMGLPPFQAHCVFCRIAAGQIPCYKVYEDEHLLAFLDINPVSRGHLLVIPKGHWERLDQMPSEVAAELGRVIPMLGKAVMNATGLTDWNLLQNNGKSAGQVVEHVHFHLIPRRVGDGLGYRWPAGKLPDAEARVLMEAIQQARGSQA